MENPQGSSHSRSCGGDAAGAPVIKSGLNDTTFDNNLNVNAGSSYSYRIVAKNSSGSSETSTVNVSVPVNTCR